MVGVARASRLGRWSTPWSYAFIGLVTLLVSGFGLAPGDLIDKARIVLHGLCAQRPAHTFALGGTPLPFDARMTGIYLGVLLSAVPLLLGRQRGTLIGGTWLVVLVGGVLLMGMDGLNSLRVDLGLSAWWRPDNRLRLVTGLMAGVGLGVALVWLLNVTLWPVQRQLPRARDGMLWLGGAALMAVTVISGASWALAPVTILLLLGALLVLVVLSMTMLSLVWPGLARGLLAGSENGWPALARPATLALALAVAMMIALAGMRFALEMMVGSAHF